VTGPNPSPFLGRWRLTEADVWERCYLDLLEPAYVRFGDDGHGEMAFGALQAELRCELGPLLVFFTFEGHDDLHPISGSGTAETLPDGSLELEISYESGDEATLKGRRW